MKARAAEQLSAATAALVTQGNIEAEREKARLKAEKEAAEVRWGAGSCACWLDVCMHGWLARGRRPPSAPPAHRLASPCHSLLPPTAVTHRRRRRSGWRRKPRRSWRSKRRPRTPTSAASAASWRVRLSLGAAGRLPPPPQGPARLLAAAVLLPAAEPARVPGKQPLPPPAG